MREYKGKMMQVKSKINIVKSKKENTKDRKRGKMMQTKSKIGIFLEYRKHEKTQKKKANIIRKSFWAFNFG